MSTFNLADLFELAVDHMGDRELLICDDQRCDYRQMEERANRLAHSLAARGIGPGDHVGIYAMNCLEWVEILWAVFKLGGVWININYRYVERELSYLMGNADLKAIFCQRRFLPRLAAVRAGLPSLREVYCLEDGSEAELLVVDADYEEMMAAGSPERDFAPRTADALYMLYTGGTTGMPKGVVWRHGDVLFALGGGVDAVTGERAKEPMDLVRRGMESDSMTMLSLAPLMHGACQWAVMGGAFGGRRMVLMERFEAERAWRLVERERIEGMMLTGDAMARPMIEKLAELGATIDVSSLALVTSTAALFSPAVKDEFFSRFPSLLMLDGVGSSESGSHGMSVIQSGATAMRGGPTITPVSGCSVLDDELRVVAPGSDTVGHLATTGDLPLCYYKDEKKSAETFVIGADGRRYSLSGDMAMVEADGRITILGRGSVCINSGGMKVFPEEVEQVLKSHPDVLDAVVTAAPHERWHECVAAVVEPRAGTSPTLEELQEHSRTELASFKLPRRLHLVERMQRSPSGKADYAWAKSLFAELGSASA